MSPTTPTPANETTETADRTARGDEGRALLTDTERAILSGEKVVSDNYRRKVVSVVHRRIEHPDRLDRDIQILYEHHPALYASARDVVCRRRERSPETD
ncbi:hypothetical protein [Halegenticoccus tardaugens]|uniref:hypothetical protein n=1 Tax=Halegenticoccus tardaugens TaxID=2071624 RepID=UPI001E636D48|nr:hypothetical protein [Halegenticoccus tardaugens]